MKKFMLCIASYNDYRKEFYEKIIRPNNLKYCLKHNIEYIDFTEGVSPIRNNFIWVKTFKISQLLKTMNENDLLISIDADIAIFDHEVEFNLSQGKSFSYSKSCNQCFNYQGILSRGKDQLLSVSDLMRNSNQLFRELAILKRNIDRAF